MEDIKSMQGSLKGFVNIEGGPNKNIKLNVGGQMFETSLHTLNKYPESALGKAISQRDWKMFGILKVS